MSVINQMLKELDQRNTGNTAGNNTGSGNRIPMSHAVSEENNHFKIVVAVIVIILLLLSVYYFKFMRNAIISERAQLSVDSPVKEQQIAVVESKVENKVVEENAANKSNESNNTVEKKPVLEQAEAVVTHLKLEQSKPVIIKEENRGIETAEPARIIKSERQPDIKVQTNRLYKSARKKLESNQFSEASLLLEQAITLRPDFHNARILQFSILFQRQQFDSLNQQVEKSLQLWPDVHEYRLMSARLLLQQDLKTEALSILHKDIPSVVDAPEYHALLAYTAQQLEQDQLAKQHYQLLLQQQTNRADWWLGLAVSEERLGNKESALQAYQHAVEKRGLSEGVLKYARQRIRVLQGF